MSAREVMARAQADYWDNPDIPEAYWPMVDAQLAALTAAGFRIVGPEEDTAMGVVNMLLCVDFDRFTEHDHVLLESVLADARAMVEK